MEPEQSERAKEQPKSKHQMTARCTTHVHCFFQDEIAQKGASEEKGCRRLRKVLAERTGFEPASENTEIGSNMENTLRMERTRTRNSLRRTNKKTF